MDDLRWITRACPSVRRMGPELAGAPADCMAEGGLRHVDDHAAAAAVRGTVQDKISRGSGGEALGRSKGGRGTKRGQRAGGNAGKSL